MYTTVEAMRLPGCEGAYRGCALGGDFQMTYTVLSLIFGMHHFSFASLGSDK